MHKPPEIPSEPPSQPPDLNSTASWYTQPAWNLFQEISAQCGVPTAKFIFQHCIDVAGDQEQRTKRLQQERDRRRTATPWKLPALEKIKDASRKQICIWWDRLSSTDQQFSEREKRVISLLTARYLNVRGYPANYKPGRLPPIKKRGAYMRNNPNTELPKLFDRIDPKSPFSIEKAKRGGKLSQAEYAATLVPKHGATAEHVLANLRYWRRARI